MSVYCPLCRVPWSDCVCQTTLPRAMALTDLARQELQRERDQKARMVAMRALFGPWPTCAESEVVTSHSNSANA